MQVGWGDGVACAGFGAGAGCGLHRDHHGGGDIGDLKGVGGSVGVGGSGVGVAGSGVTGNAFGVGMAAAGTAARDRCTTGRGARCDVVAGLTADAFAVGLGDGGGISGPAA